MVFGPLASVARASVVNTQLARAVSDPLILLWALAAVVDTLASVTILVVGSLALLSRASVDNTLLVRSLVKFVICLCATAAVAVTLASVTLPAEGALASDNLASLVRQTAVPLCVIEPVAERLPVTATRALFISIRLLVAGFVAQVVFVWKVMTRSFLVAIRSSSVLLVVISVASAAVSLDSLKWHLLALPLEAVKTEAPVAGVTSTCIVKRWLQSSLLVHFSL